MMFDGHGIRLTIQAFSYAHNLLYRNTRLIYMYAIAAIAVVCMQHEVAN